MTEFQLTIGQDGIQYVMFLGNVQAPGADPWPTDPR